MFLKLKKENPMTVSSTSNAVAPAQLSTQAVDTSGKGEKVAPQRDEIAELIGKVATTVVASACMTLAFNMKLVSSEQIQKIEESYPAEERALYDNLLEFTLNMVNRMCESKPQLKNIDENRKTSATKFSLIAQMQTAPQQFRAIQSDSLTKLLLKRNEDKNSASSNSNSDKTESKKEEGKTAFSTEMKAEN